MNKNNSYEISKRLTSALFFRLFLAIVGFTVALIGIFLFASFIFSRFIWYEGDLLYTLLKPIDDHPLPFLIGIWTIGSIGIFLYFLRRTLRYIDEITEASKKLISDKDEVISLPRELMQVEERMNMIKQESIKNALIAKEAEQRKNDLIVYLAHDLKTPLTSVIGYLTLLRDEKQISEELRQKYLSITLDKAERLEELTNEFFEITRFNLSHISLDISSINLTRMMEQIAFEFQTMFAEKSLTCSLELDQDLQINCDVNKMERVFDNLIRNAINYSYENSNITIKGKREGNNIILQFINSGSTIPKDKLERIFEQFYRLDSSRGTKKGGAGLGLAIAKQIVESHGGTIQAHSENDMIQFDVTLPSVVRNS